MKITVLGSGGWGIALALAAYNNNNTVALWSPFENEVDLLNKTRQNEKLLPNILIPNDITITSDINVINNDDITVIAVPSKAVEQVSKKIANFKTLGVIVNVAKGFEQKSLKRLSEVISRNTVYPVVVLSGPSHAEEVSKGIPTSLVASSKDNNAALKVIEAFASENIRIYTNDDMVGVELGGALKNIIAVAAGFCDGLGLGDNSKAALITRGLAEMVRLGVKMGADERTFTGLTGMGDLIVTCTSVHSRNNRFGKLVGSGVLVENALEIVGTVEGYHATKLAFELSKKYGVEMPITEECYKVLYMGQNPKDTVKNLMLRPQRAEKETLWPKF